MEIHVTIAKLVSQSTDTLKTWINGMIDDDICVVADDLGYLLKCDVSRLRNWHKCTPSLICEVIGQIPNKYFCDMFTDARELIYHMFNVLSIKLADPIHLADFVNNLPLSDECIVKLMKVIGMSGMCYASACITEKKSELDRLFNSSNCITYLNELFNDKNIELFLTNKVTSSQLTHYENKLYYVDTSHIEDAYVPIQKATLNDLIVRDAPDPSPVDNIITQLRNMEKKYNEARMKTKTMYTENQVRDIVSIVTGTRKYVPDAKVMTFIDNLSMPRMIDQMPLWNETNTPDFADEYNNRPASDSGSDSASDSGSGSFHCCKNCRHDCVSDDGFYV